MSKNDWYIPKTTMDEAEKNRKGKDKRWGKKPNAMYHCKKCGLVYKNANFVYRQYREDCEEEYYPRDSMPTYGLEKKDCLKCK